MALIIGAIFLSMLMKLNDYIASLEAKSNANDSYGFAAQAVELAKEEAIELAKKQRRQNNVSAKKQRSLKWLSILFYTLFYFLYCFCYFYIFITF